MNPEIKAKWVAALRSGEYKQGMYVLRRGDAFCCLGVLCDLRAKSGMGKWRTERGRLVYDDGSETSISTLNAVVLSWAELEQEEPCVRLADKDTLACRNDAGATFAEIADIIEREL